MKTYTVERYNSHVNLLKLDDDEYIARRFAIECAERALPIFESDVLFDKRIRNAIEVARQFIDKHKNSLDNISLFDDLANALVNLSADAWAAAWMWAHSGAKRYAAEAAAFAAAIHLPANIAARSAAAAAIAAISEKARSTAMAEGAEAALEAARRAREAEEAWQVARLQQLRWEGIRSDVHGISIQ